MAAGCEKLRVSLLTGGGDRPYAHGLALSLAEAGVASDFIGSDFLESDELRSNPLVRFLNLRGDMDPQVPVLAKVARVLKYYGRLMTYAATTKVKTFHILWNNKIETFDRTFLLIYYKALGKRLVYTVHNVNIRKRDGNDSCLNRATLKIQYALCDHLFVHTDLMKRELVREFGVSAGKITVIPFPINATVPSTDLTAEQARARLGLYPAHKVVLFFGNIAPYKGLHLLLEAMAQVICALPDARLVIAGRPKGDPAYWRGIEKRLNEADIKGLVISRIEYVPDEDTELFFKAADVLVLPYLSIFQSGVLFLSYNFGLPVLATDVGCFKDDIEEGRTGYVVRPGDTAALRDGILRYFASDLYLQLGRRRQDIRGYVAERHSWEGVAQVTCRVYSEITPPIA
jgi:glycosyltransferase involved in cell wall biosynthesis